MTDIALKSKLNKLYKQYAVPNFLPDDPLSIPHSFSKKEDIEISAFFSTMLAWGQRPTIINNLKNLMNRMDNAPFQFITQHSNTDLIRLQNFKHRTFNDSDLLFFVARLKELYSIHPSMENLFIENSLENGMNRFRKFFFETEFCLDRAKKHLSSPETKSACKRVNLFLRWMVRSPKEGLDFGIWTSIKQADLFCPLDVHTGRSARNLGLLERKQDDWLAVIQLTHALRRIDPTDPVKYDLALFGYSESRNI